MQERGGPAITMLSSAMMEDGLPTATAMEEGGAHLRRGGATSMATSMATSEHSGAARGGGGAPACAGPQPPGPSPPSRISSRDLAQLDLSEIELLAQGIDLRELERSLGSPRSRGLGSPRSFSSPASPGHPALPLPSLRLSPSIPPHATQPPRISREGPSSLSVGGVGSMGSVGTLELSAGSGAHTATRQHGAHLDAAPAAAGSAASGLQKAAVDYYFNQLSLMAEHGLQEQGLH